MIVIFEKSLIAHDPSFTQQCQHFKLYVTVIIQKNCRKINHNDYHVLLQFLSRLRVIPDEFQIENSNFHLREYQKIYAPSLYELFSRKSGRLNFPRCRPF